MAIFMGEERSTFHQKAGRFLLRCMDRKTNGLPDGFPNGLAGIRAPSAECCARCGATALIAAPTASQ